jgi:hypothetical protein
VLDRSAGGCQLYASIAISRVIQPSATCSGNMVLYDKLSIAEFRDLHRDRVMMSLPESWSGGTSFGYPEYGHGICLVGDGSHDGQGCSCVFKLL